jgi:hypothetical protein
MSLFICKHLNDLHHQDFKVIHVYHNMSHCKVCEMTLWQSLPVESF